MRQYRFPSRLVVAVIVLLLVFSLGVIAYWVSFYTSGDVNLNADADYLAFERAFTAADLMTAVLAIVSAIGLMLRRGWGVLFGLVCAGGILFLGFMDISYDLTHGIYLAVSGPMVAEVLINLFCVVVAPIIIVTLWRNRRSLGA